MINRDEIEDAAAVGMILTYIISGATNEESPVLRKVFGPRYLELAELLGDMAEDIKKAFKS